MKIISKFSDYYDCIRRMDTDNMHTYVRHTKDIVPPRRICSIDDNEYSKYNVNTDIAIQIISKMFILGFCGEIHFGFNVEKSRLIGRYGKDRDKKILSIRLLYGDYDFAMKLDEKCDTEVHGKPKYKSKYGPMKYMLENTRQKAFGSANIGKCKKLFLEHNVPVFAIENYSDDKYPRNKQKIILNPCLKDYGFYKIKDNYTAYQDISMFVGNDLVDDKDKQWPVDDKLKAMSKGFDKYSFRKGKQKKSSS